MKRLFKPLLLAAFLLSALSTSADGNKAIKILAIGNSFSQDAVEQYLHELAQAEGYTTIIGNMYIGGCPLEKHYANARDNSASYSYRKRGTDGVKVTTENVSLETALKDEEWDYVSLQQASGKSGLYDTYNPYLPWLIDYVRTLVPASTKLIWHQTWAYAQDSNHAEFTNYDKDQMTMYRAIVSASRKAVTDNGISILVPSGTAIQNARTTFIGDNMNRDGYHLNTLYGRYTAACTWFETIFGKSAVGNSYAPEGMTSDLINATQNAAHAAVMNPDAVTDLSYIQETFSDAAYYIRSDDDALATSGGDGTSWDTAFRFSEWVSRLSTFDKGTTFYFAGGTYYPSGAIAINNAFTLIGGFSPSSTGTTEYLPQFPSAAPTIFSGDKNRNGLTDEGDLAVIIKADMTAASKNTLPVVLQGIDFTSAYYNSPDGSGEYGAIYMKDCQDMTVRDCRFYGNTAPGYGGIAVRSEYSKSHFTDCTFTNNKAKSRGAVARLSSNAGNKGNTTFERCSFTDNEIEDNTGSVICMQHGQALYIINTTIADNEAGSGGAIYVNGKNSTFPNAFHVVSSTIAGNGHNQIQLAQGGNLNMANSIIVGSTDNGTVSDAAIAVTGGTSTPLLFTSAGYNITGGYANQLSSVSSPVWHETDVTGTSNSVTSVFGNAVLSNGTLTPVNAGRGASIETLQEIASAFGITGCDLTVDQHGNERGNTVPGAVKADANTAICQTAIVPAIKEMPFYNLAGQKTGAGYKGIAVSKGRKILYRGGARCK